MKEQVTFSVDNLYPKIADSVKPIRKKPEYLERCQEHKNKLVRTIYRYRDSNNNVPD